MIFALLVAPALATGLSLIARATNTVVINKQVRQKAHGRAEARLVQLDLLLTPEEFKRVQGSEVGELLAAALLQAEALRQSGALPKCPSCERLWLDRRSTHATRE